MYIVCLYLYGREYTFIHDIHQSPSKKELTHWEKINAETLKNCGKVQRTQTRPGKAPQGQVAARSFSQEGELSAILALGAEGGSCYQNPECWWTGLPSRNWGLQERKGATANSQAQPGRNCRNKHPSLPSYLWSTGRSVPTPPFLRCPHSTGRSLGSRELTNCPWSQSSGHIAEKDGERKGRGKWRLSPHIEYLGKDSQDSRFWWKQETLKNIYILFLEQF